LQSKFVKENLQILCRLKFTTDLFDAHKVMKMRVLVTIGSGTNGIKNEEVKSKTKSRLWNGSVSDRFVIEDYKFYHKAIKYKLLTKNCKS